MKYSKRMESLFLQKFYIRKEEQRVIGGVVMPVASLTGPTITYHKEEWMIKNVISLKKVRLFKVLHPLKGTFQEIVVDVRDCNMQHGSWHLDVVLYAWLRNIVNLRQLISNWNTAKKKGGLKHSDMFQYTTKEEVWDDITRVLGRETRREHKRLLKASGIKLVHQSKTYSIFKLLSYEGAIVLGKNTKWCIASTADGIVGRKTFNSYNEQSDMFVIIDRRTNEKWCVLYSRHKGYVIKLCNNEGGMFDFKRKITCFEQKDVELDEKQLHAQLGKWGWNEEFLREIFDKHAGSRLAYIVENQQSSAVSMRYDYQEVDRYGMRDHGNVIGAL